MKNLFLRLMVGFFVLFGMTSLMANTKVDIIFAMDTSGSMDDEAIALKNAIADIKQDLSNTYDLDMKYWGISYTNTSWGLTSNVRKEVGYKLANGSEDWAPAVNDLSKHYNGWRSDTVKIIIPISDECPDDGDGCYQNDEDSIIDARNEADNHNMNVLPIVASISGTEHSTALHSKIEQLASNLSTVNGKIIRTSSSVYANEMKEAIKDIIASVTGDIVRKPIFGNYSVQGNYINIPITKASGATSIEWAAKENGTLAFNGISGTDKISISVPIVDIQTHEYNVTARSKGVDKGGTIIYSDWVSTTVKYIGDPSNLQNECDSNVVIKPPQCNTQKELIGEEAPTENPATSEDKVETKLTQVSDPVDITTGNFYLSKTDIAVKTAGIPFMLTRQYNSLLMLR